MAMTEVKSQSLLRDRLRRSQACARILPHIMSPNRKPSASTKAKARAPRTWTEKLEPLSEARLEKDGRERRLVPTPMLVAEELVRVRIGQLITPSELRERLAVRMRADLTCTRTTTRCLQVLAMASEEALRAGRRAIAPWWRIVDDKGTLHDKSEPGVERQRKFLLAEGHELVKSKAGKWRVEGFDPARAASKREPIRR